MKNFNDFAEDLGARESGGYAKLGFKNQYEVKNAWGFLGKYQFGKPRLWDLGLSINGWKPKDGRPAKKIISEKGFLSNSVLQEDIFKLHVDNLLKRVKERYASFIGKTVNDILITESGLVAGAHLKGFGGVNQFLKGEDNADALGTNISEYISKFAGYNLDNHLHVHIDQEENKDIPKRTEPYTVMEEKKTDG